MTRANLPSPASFLYTVWFPLSIFICLAGLYMWVVPLGESPDEPGHLVCIDQVARLGRLPIVDPIPTGEPWTARTRLISGRMCYHMPLYYLLAGGVQAGLTAVSQQTLPVTYPPSNPNFYQAEPNLFIHRTTQEPLTTWGLRLVSILLSGFVLYTTWQISQSIWPRQYHIATFATLFIATWPQFIFASRSINNDVLAVALSVAILWVLVANQTPQRFWLVALLSGLAILTKLSVLFTLGVIVAVLLLDVWQNQQNWAQYAKVGTGCLVIWGIIFGLIFTHPTLSQHIAISGINTNIPSHVWTWAYWQEVLTLTASSGWGRFGWMNIPLPMWHVWLWWGFVILLMSAAIPNLIKEQPRIALIFAIWIAGALASYIRINLTLFQPQFRFLLPIMPVLTVLMSKGLTQLTKKTKPILQDQTKRLPQLVSLGLLFFLVSYNLWVVTTVLYPVYWS